jgi:hypothetical protein
MTLLLFSGTIPQLEHSPSLGASALHKIPTLNQPIPA